MVDNIILPRTDVNGKPRISYSQIKSWGSKEGFNKFEDRNISGSTEYILRYFLNYNFPSSPMDIYGKWGTMVEAYIAEGIKGDLTQEEMDILDKAPTLSKFQEEINIDFGDFVVTGFADSCNDDRSHIIDYKSASKTTAKQYSTPDYFQLDLYSLEKYKEKGLIPKLEVVILERSGNHFGKPLKCVGTFTISRETSAERLLWVESYVRSIVREISSCYKLFLEINK